MGDINVILDTVQAKKTADEFVGKLEKIGDTATTSGNKIGISAKKIQTSLDGVHKSAFNAKSSFDTLTDSITNVSGRMDMTAKRIKSSFDSIEGHVKGAQGSFESLSKSAAKIGTKLGTGSKKIRNSLNDLNKGLRNTTSSTSQLVTSVGRINTALNKLETKMKRVTNENARLREANKKTESSFKNLASFCIRFYAITLSLRTAFEGLVAIFKAGMELQSLNRAFMAITGSAEKATEELKWLKEEAGKIGVEFYKTADGYKNLAAAGKEANMSSKTIRDTFIGVSSASVALGLSTEKTHGILYALTQMISKGKVQTEELRRQMGEHLPGAYELAAKSIGVTTNELGEMLKKGTLLTKDFLPKFSKAMIQSFKIDAALAINDPRQQLNLFITAWKDFLIAVGQSGAMESMVNGLTDLREILKDTTQWFLESKKGLEIFYNFMLTIPKSIFDFIESITQLLTFGEKYTTLMDGVTSGTISWTQAMFHTKDSLKYLKELDTDPLVKLKKDLKDLIETQKIYNSLGQVIGKKISFIDKESGEKKLYTDEINLLEKRIKKVEELREATKKANKEKETSIDPLEEARITKLKKEFDDLRKKIDEKFKNNPVTVEFILEKKWKKDAEEQFKELKNLYSLSVEFGKPDESIMDEYNKLVNDTVSMNKKAYEDDVKNAKKAEEQKVKDALKAKWKLWDEQNKAFEEGVKSQYIIESHNLKTMTKLQKAADKGNLNHYLEMLNQKDEALQESFNRQKQMYIAFINSEGDFYKSSMKKVYVELKEMATKYSPELGKSIVDEKELDRLINRFKELKPIIKDAFKELYSGNFENSFKSLFDNVKNYALDRFAEISAMAIMPKIIPIFDGIDKFISTITDDLSKGISGALGDGIKDAAGNVITSGLGLSGGISSVLGGVLGGGLIGGIGMVANSFISGGGLFGGSKSPDYSKLLSNMVTELKENRKALEYNSKILINSSNRWAESIRKAIEEQTQPTLDLIDAFKKAYGMNGEKADQLKIEVQMGNIATFVDYLKQQEVLATEQVKHAEEQYAWAKKQSTGQVDLKTYANQLSSAQNQLADVSKTLEGMGEIAASLGIDLNKIFNDIAKEVNNFVFSLTDNRTEYQKAVDEYSGLFNEVQEGLENLAAMGLEVDFNTFENDFVKAWEAIQKKFKEQLKNTFKEIESYVNSFNTSINSVQMQFDEMFTKMNEFKEALINSGMEANIAAQKIHEYTEQAFNYLTESLTQNMIAPLQDEFDKLTMSDYDYQVKLLTDNLKEQGDKIKQIADTTRQYEWGEEAWKLAKDIYDLQIKALEAEKEKATISLSGDVAAYMASLTGGTNSVQTAINDVTNTFEGFAEKARELGYTNKQIFDGLIDDYNKALEIVKKTELKKIMDEVNVINGNLSEFQVELKNIDEKFIDMKESAKLAGASVDELNAIQMAWNKTIKETRKEMEASIYSPLISVKEDIDFLESGMSKIDWSISQFNQLSAKGGNFTIDDAKKMAQLMADIYNEAKSGWNEVADAQAEVGKIWEDAADKVKDLINTIEETQRDIKYSSLNVGLFREKRIEATLDYDKLYQAALSGDEQAINEYMSFAKTYLDVAQEDLKSSQEYQDIYNKVLSDMDVLKSNVNPQMFIDQQQLKAAQDAVAELQTSNMSLEEVKSLLSGMWDTLKSSSSVLGLFGGGGGGASMGAGGGGGGGSGLGYTGLTMQGIEQKYGLAAGTINKEFAQSISDNWAGTDEQIQNLANQFNVGTVAIVTAVDDILNAFNVPAPSGWEQQLYGDIPQMATGGIAMHPMFAQIAESGPEAVIPLDKLHEYMGGGNATVNVNVYVANEELGAYVENIAITQAENINVLARKKNVTNRQRLN